MDKRLLFVLAVMADSIVLDVQHQRNLAGQVVVDAASVQFPKDVDLEVLSKQYVRYQYGLELRPNWFDWPTE